MIAKSSRMIPVVFGEAIDSAAHNFIECPPVIFIHIAADADWTEASQALPRHNGEIYKALIDTGSNRIAIRPDVATAIGAASNGDGTGHWVGETQTDLKKVSIQILSTKGDIVFVCRDAAATKLPGDSRSFDAILGRQFLKHCRFFVDGPNGRYRLEWLGQPEHPAE